MKEIPNYADLVLLRGPELIKRGCKIVDAGLLFNKMPSEAFTGDSNT